MNHQFEKGSLSAAPNQGNGKKMEAIDDHTIKNTTVITTNNDNNKKHQSRCVEKNKDKI